MNFPEPNPALAAPGGVQRKPATRRAQAKPGRSDFLPLLGLPLVTAMFFNILAPWVFVWAMALALWAGCKWLTWRRADTTGVPVGRSLAYLFAWPGMDAQAFLGKDRPVAKPLAGAWFWAVGKTVLGIFLVWGVTPFVPASHVLLKGWTGMVGLILLLHFGTFHLLALAWQAVGINAAPLMCSPLTATSVGEFWGRRWNRAFSGLAHDLIFRPWRRRVGARGATMLVFLVSGLVHELVLSVPARGGYGLPTIYFLVQGLGVMGEHTTPGRRLGLGRGLPGWAFSVVIAAGPAFWLLHPPFIRNVILPMLQALGAN